MYTMNNSVYSHHIECILKSKILLDDDLNIILSSLNIKMEDQSSTYNYITVFSIVTSLTGIALSYKYNKTIYAMLTSLPLSLNLVLYSKQQYSEYCCKKRMDNLVRNLIEMHKLNRSILNYIKTRYTISTSSTIKLFNYVTDRGKEFLEYFSIEIINMLQLLKECIIFLDSTEICKHIDYSYIKECNINDYKIESTDDDSEFITKIQRIVDLTVLLTSHFLSCFALAFNKAMYKSAFYIKNSLNEKLYHVQESTEKTVTNIRRKFNDISLHVDKDLKCEIKKDVAKLPFKIKEPMFSLLTHLQISLEMAQKIYLDLQQADIERKQNNIQDGLNELKIELNDCSNLLHMLIKINDILYNNKPYKKDVEIQELSLPPREIPVPVICHDDFPAELEDEEYDIYITDQNENSETITHMNEEDMRNTVDLSVLLQELKHSLRQRQAAIASRKKVCKTEGGVKIEIRESNNEIKDGAKLNVNTLENREDVDVSSVLKEQLSPIFSSPLPPLPPPPPLNYLPTTSETSANTILVDDFKKTIKFMANQRCHNEDIFGDSCDEEEHDFNV